LRGYESVSHHTVCDIYIDSKYRIFDPDFGFVFYIQRQIAAFDDIQQRRFEIESQKMKALQILAGFKPADYLRLYDSNYNYTVF